VSSGTLNPTHSLTHSLRPEDSLQQRPSTVRLCRASHRQFFNIDSIVLTNKNRKLSLLRLDPGMSKKSFMQII